ncbi:MAG: UDP-2,3-diacylglucosamine diphosphatase [gamma proteobacterium endosymbiont of Lamellibrachia anaximandri]|nr:UDP-2,3-diacylglucosamine diphosphatase [gamma proteobacterium endosymbiont of Lamellibrachia anaximandri]MBL3534761.1 UDP-2,3-diacylglucosamine diphosphatase [gamma proteobacterium endosymbiont of Lamellibrachia anaximandri]
MAETLFISDLHLSDDQPETVQLFLDFLERRAPGADRLYILGDLFDAWIGDDLEIEPAQRIKIALKRLYDSGSRILLMHGNRDFLLGEQFCAQTGAELIDDPTQIDLFGTATLLMHGDLLCTDDLPYQAFRRQVRDPAFITQFLSRTIPERIAIAQEYRAKSGEATSLKAAGIMDVNQTTVEQYMENRGVRRLIHGHTHRPGRHDFMLSGEKSSRFVLGEWHSDHAEILVASPKGLRVETIKPV